MTSRIKSATAPAHEIDDLETLRNTHLATSPYRRVNLFVRYFLAESEQHLVGL